MITDKPTPCFEKTQLFDSTFEADHVIARDLCLGCPARTECIAERTKTIELLGIMSLEGTWAGNLYTGKKERPRSRCGTSAGYTSHKYRNEEACAPCKKAESDAVCARRKKRAAKDQETAA